MKRLSLFVFGVMLTLGLMSFLAMRSLFETLEETDFLEDLED